MNRRSFNTLLGSALLGSALLVHAQGNSQGHGHGHDRDEGDDDRGEGHGKGHGHGNGNGHAYGRDKHDDSAPTPYFREQDYGYLARNYNGPRNLPPGLRKKYYRTGALPPGWEKRFRPMPPVVVQQLPPVPVGYQRGYLDGYAVVLDPRTRMVVDAVDILNAATGR